ncbi:unnamed protein product [Dracunculus medinensis]|uniref:Tyrosine aminotransferase n=1 Tax=Dracunculus medinensis TaxID=318479 RepID=A0A3P7T3P5_DRAME|nr:unnamed protein product [Dracunculus medinensis]
MAHYFFVRKWSHCKVSQHAAKTVNSIRRISEFATVTPNPHKAPIMLHLGDPTLNIAFRKCQVVLDAVEKALKSRAYEGYAPSIGHLEARDAIAKHFTHPDAPITAEDVILTSGCSHALQIVIESLANSGDNILIPSPGFPLYSTMMQPHLIEDRLYPLIMEENDVHIDLSKLEQLIDHRTRAIIVNNPSNPVGSAYPKSHLEDILKIAYRKRLPIIADEIYGNMVYNGSKFIPIATLKPQVPIICCDGLSKRYMVPGWRIGWIIIHNRYGALDEIYNGMINLTQKIVGPCCLIQGALPTILNEFPDDYLNEINKILSKNAEVIFYHINRIKGLTVIKPSGAMYIMIKIDLDYFKTTEAKFIKGLISEENLYCLPGEIFNAPPGYFRIVLTQPKNILYEACQRIKNFCLKLRDSNK